MSKTLLFKPSKQKKHYYLILCLTLLFIQKSVATTFYINDSSNKGDIYTTVVGNDANDGISSTSPKLSIWECYQKAQDGDTIIIDTGSYKDVSSKGALVFSVTKKITFIIAGVSDAVYSKIPLTKKDNAAPAEFYIDKDKPVSREIYMQRFQNGVLKQP